MTEQPEQQKPPRKIQKRTIDGRERIINSAARKFVEEGYKGASLSDIILDADSNKRFFYNQFSEGKRDVARAIMANTLTMNGLVPQRLKIQEIYDIGMILAYRVAREDALLAAVKLSFEFGSYEEYGTPWGDWVAFNTGQLEDAQRQKEIRPHVVPAEQARQLSGFWSGLVLTAIVVDGGLHEVEAHISRGYQNLMAAIAVPEVLPFVDFSVDRGEKLYVSFLESQAQKESAEE
ncbi:TetR/AcrR family transcriptional regulator [Streptomyces sp. NPDC050548]|uniref:TetR/AcrR family transcriptional regulator n=1 Tax=Streptomyces sp. NPDC050548 TaxID=3365629 RepID=UPI0037AC1120